MSLPEKSHRRQPLPSADAVAGNENMMTEILIRLPAKSLRRFKCVSKGWNSLISHPHFSLLRMHKSMSGLLFLINSHDTRPTYKYLHLFGKRTRSAPFKSLSFGDDGLTIIHSCNGLLLCSSTINTEIGKKNYYACNPTTKQLAIIPPPHPSFVVKPTAPPSMNLAFHLATAPHYKIVLVHYHSKFGYQIQIYSSETGTWRLSGDPFTPTHDHGFKNGVFLNGTIHWTSSQSEISFRFDVDRECVETMPMPPFQGDSKFRHISYFGESGGHLHLICHEDHKRTPFDVLEMESDY